MRFNLTIIIILSSIFIIKSVHKLPRLTRKEIFKMEKNKESLALIYIDPKNISHNFFLEEVSNYLQTNPLNKYNFGYLDIEDDKRMLEYFKIKNERDSGVIFYKFDNKNYYVGEGINHLNEVKELFEQIMNNKLNWSSNSIIESIFYLITGKRDGKEAHSMFSFGICVISLLVYIFVNTRARRLEREMIEKRLKTE